HGALGHFSVPLLLRQIDDGNVRALAREEDRHGAADAGVAAGDERRASIQFARALVVRRLEARLRIDLRLEARLALVLRLEGRLWLPRGRTPGRTALRFRHAARVKWGRPLAARTVPGFPYIPAHVAQHSPPRNLGIASDRRTQRVVARGPPRGRDADVRLRRGHAAADDAIRSLVRTPGYLLHAHARRSFARRDRIDPNDGAPGSRRTPSTVGTEGDIAHAQARRRPRIRARDLSSYDRRSGRRPANSTKRLFDRRVPGGPPRIDVVRLRDRRRREKGSFQSGPRPRARDSRGSALGPDPARTRHHARRRTGHRAVGARRPKAKGTTSGDHRRHPPLRG